MFSVVAACMVQQHMCKQQETWCCSWSLPDQPWQRSDAKSQERRRESKQWPWHSDLGGPLVCPEGGKGIKEKGFQRAPSGQERKRRGSPVQWFCLPVPLPPEIPGLHLAEEWFCSGSKEAEQLLVDAESWAQTQQHQVGRRKTKWGFSLVSGKIERTLVYVEKVPSLTVMYPHVEVIRKLIIRFRPWRRISILLVFSKLLRLMEKVTSFH